MKQSIEICISTMNHEFPEWIKSSFPCPILVVNQCDEDSVVNLTDNVKVINTTSIGLSRSRNIAFSEASAKYLYICDNDNSFSKNSLIELSRELEIDNPDVAICSSNLDEFSIMKKKKLNIRDIFSIASWQICVRKEIAQRIGFNERFGLGSNKISHGEENIFLANALKSGLTIIGYPIKVVNHPDLGTGYNHNPKFYTEKYFIYKEMVGIFFAIILIVRKFIIRQWKRSLS